MWTIPNRTPNAPIRALLEMTEDLLAATDEPGLRSHWRVARERALAITRRCESVRYYETFRAISDFQWLRETLGEVEEFLRERNDEPEGYTVEVGFAVEGWNSYPLTATGGAG